MRSPRFWVDATTMQCWPAPLSYAESAAWVERNIARYGQHSCGRMLLLRKHDGIAIGDCGIVATVVNGRPEHDLGYIVHYPYWRQGYAVEAARACLNDGRARLGLRRIVANMAHDHIASARVAEKLGMQRVGVFNNERNRGMVTWLYVWEESGVRSQESGGAGR
ncbi:GNAT family N-acetyltransferase [Candidatus Gracilibacteria bacterium]|nr:GNAT family N-acetyltransferase [Candidatus Gracilibacteria bacterium]